MYIDLGIIHVDLDLPLIIRYSSYVVEVRVVAVLSARSVRRSQVSARRRKKSCFIVYMYVSPQAINLRYLFDTMSGEHASLSASVMPESHKSEPLPSVGSLQELQQILKDGAPFAGRKVMVPITRQAFMEGHLQPPTDDSVSSVGEEIVLANLGSGHLAEMSRDDAADFIQRRIDAAVAPKMSTSASKKKQPKKSALISSAKTTAKSQPPAQSHTILPFFEIREEYDASGHEVKAEAVNVANDMKALKDALRSQKTGANGDGDYTKQIRELIETIDIGVDDDTCMGQESSGDFDAEDEAIDDVEPERQEPVSDEQYNSLSTRLDELARMEEDDEKNKSEGKSSRQRLQGKAWGKGFLSSKGGRGGATAGKSQEGKTGKKKKKDAAAGGWNSGFLNAEPKKKKASAGGTTVTTNTADEPERQRKVAFGTDEVKEIPRIGNTSIKAAQQMQKAGRLQQQQPVAMPQEEQQESEPISREVFSGVVTERSAIGTSTSTSVMSPEQPEQQQQPPPKKKLSRFAQQRLEQRGGL